MPRPRSLRSLTLNQSVVGITSGPPSPTLSEATQASQMNFGAEGPEKIITRADLKSSLQAYENLLSASSSYRDALMHMSKAAANLADALENCATLKGASYLSGTRVMAASGLHHLMGNHWHVLSDSIEKQFEKPLRQHLDTYRTTVSDRSASYERALRDKSRIIRQTEMENMNLGRKKNRNLQTFREALAVLQRQVEELDELRVSYYQEILEHEEEVWDFVQGKVSLVVRSTLDVLDRCTSKASDPVIEPMLQSIPDPFDSYGPPKPEDQIFSILAPLSIFNSPSPSSPQVVTDEIDSSPAFSAGPSGLSWTNHETVENSTSEWADVHTPIPSPPPSAKSTSTITVQRATSPPVMFSRASYPVASGSSPLSPAKSPGAVRKAESKLRKSLSVISESLPQPEVGSGSGSGSGLLSGSKSGTPTPFDAHHRRSASADTVTPHDADVNTTMNGQSRNSFADDPIWGSHETASSVTLHSDEAKKGSSLNGVGAHEREGAPDHGLDAKDSEQERLM